MEKFYCNHTVLNNLNLSHHSINCLDILLAIPKILVAHSILLITCGEKVSHIFADYFTTVKVFWQILHIKACKSW